MAVKGDHDPVLMGAHRDAGGGDHRPPRFAPGSRDTIAGPPPPDQVSVESGNRFDEQGLPILSDEEIKALREAGTEIVFPGKRPDGENRRF